MGFSVIEFSEEILELTLMPWQRWLLVHMLELRVDRSLRSPDGAAADGPAARRQVDAALGRCWRCGSMYVYGAPLVIGTAQDLDVAEEIWNGAVDMVETTPELDELKAHVYRINGKKSLVLTTGERYKVKAAEPAGGSWAGRGPDPARRAPRAPVVGGMVGDLQDHPGPGGRADPGAVERRGLDVGGVAVSAGSWRTRRWATRTASTSATTRCWSPTTRTWPRSWSTTTTRWRSSEGGPRYRVRRCGTGKAWAQRPTRHSGTRSVSGRWRRRCGSTRSGSTGTEVLCQWSERAPSRGPFPAGAWEACARTRRPGVVPVPRWPLGIDTSWDRSTTYVALGPRPATTWAESTSRWWPAGPGRNWVADWLTSSESGPRRSGPPQVALQAKGAPVSSLLPRAGRGRGSGSRNGPARRWGSRPASSTTGSGPRSVRAPGR